LYQTDTYKDKFFEGRIKEVYPRITPGNRTCKIMGSISFNHEAFSGMSVEANIIISEKKNALVIPREYLLNQNEVKLNDGKKVIKIKKGIEDLEYVEVLSGISEKDELVKP
jgi:hypothetical protein